MVVDRLLALLAPPACAACRAPLPAADALVCPWCLRELRWLGPDGCRRCALPRHDGSSTRRGAGCPAAGAAFASAWAPLAYEGSAPGLVRALKFHGALPLAGLMASQMAANAPPWALEGVSAVVPVPAAPARRRRRGFDPAALLAHELATRLRLPVADCLARSGRAPRQLGAGRAERRSAGRIQVRVTGPVPDRVLLVDDVHTTGATLSACAEALRAGGAAQVRSATLVRAL